MTMKDRSTVFVAWTQTAAVRQGLVLPCFVAATRPILGLGA